MGVVVVEVVLVVVLVVVVVLAVVYSNKTLSTNTFTMIKGSIKSNNANTRL